MGCSRGRIGSANPRGSLISSCFINDSWDALAAHWRGHSALLALCWLLLSKLVQIRDAYAYQKGTCWDSARSARCKAEMAWALANTVVLPAESPGVVLQGVAWFGLQWLPCACEPQRAWSLSYRWLRLGESSGKHRGNWDAWSAARKRCRRYGHPFAEKPLPTIPLPLALETWPVPGGTRSNMRALGQGMERQIPG